MKSSNNKNKLTLKQENACQAYVETGDKSEAYRRAYNCLKMKPEVINNKAYELFKRGDITVRVNEIQGELKKSSEIKKADILEELSCIAFSDIRDYVKFDGTTIKIKSFDDLTDKQARAIESIKKSKTGIEIKLHGKNWSVERICRMLGYDAPKDLNLNFERLPEEQLDQIIDELIKKAGNG